MSRAAAPTAIAISGIVGALVAGCAGRSTPPPVSAIGDGISIALYAVPATPGGSPARSYGVIDDRRWIDIAGDSFVLDRIALDAESDAAAAASQPPSQTAIESLVIEPLAGGRFELGACVRERVPDADPQPAGATAHLPQLLAPMLRCGVRASPGRHLIRVLHVARGLGYRALHDLAMTSAERATIVTRFAIATPAWHARATVTVWSGMPGSERPPRELVRGPVVLDGGTAILAVPPRVVPAELRRIYDGAVRAADDSDPRERRWHRDSQPAIWVWLELHDPAPAAPGAARARAGDVLTVAPVHVRIELPGEPARDIDVPPAAHRSGPTEARLPLWIDPQLHGRRDRTTGSPEDGVLTDTFLLSLASTAAQPREVWIEEELRPTRRRAVVRAWPADPSIAGHTLRMKLTLPPGKLERAGFEIHYDL